MVKLATLADHTHTALRALQNPKLFTSDHYKQAAIAVAAGILIRLAIAVPVRRGSCPGLRRKFRSPILIFAADMGHQSLSMGSLILHRHAIGDMG